MQGFSWKASSVSAIVAVTLGCGGGGESAVQKAMPPPTKKLSELKAAAPEKSKEELAAARKAAGFKSRDELAAENAAMFEGDARKYIKTRTKEYTGLLADFGKSLDSLEKAAAGWPKAKDAEKAFDKFADKYKDETKDLTKRYDELTGHGAEGGNTQAVFSKAFRNWENLNNDLNAQIAAQEQFATVLEEIRKGFAEVGTAVEEIDKDETVVVVDAEEADDQKKKK